MMTNKILITWITSWIWEYISLKLSNENQVIWTGRKEKPNIKNIDYVKWDIRDIAFINDLCNKIDPIDYLVINAWVWYFDKFENISIEQNKEIIETNLLSPILLINILLSSNKINKWIIFIGSLAWKKSMKFWASYSASKFWLRGFAMQLKNELKWIKTHIINPKIVNTNFHKNSKIEIHWKYEETSLDKIYKTIDNIIKWEEKMFEIDL